MPINVSSKPTLFDDDEAIPGRNGKPASADVMKSRVDALNAIGCRARPVFSFWGAGKDAATFQISTTLLRLMYPRTSPGAQVLDSEVIYSPGTSPSIAAPTDGQGITFSDMVSDTPSTTVLTEIAKMANATTSYPEEGRLAQSVTGGWGLGNGSEFEMLKPFAFGNVETGAPQLQSGILYEKSNRSPVVWGDAPDSAPRYLAEALPTDWYAPGSPIIGDNRTYTSGEFDGLRNDASSMEALRNYYRQVYKGKRICFGWSGVLGAADPQFIRLTSTNYRYIFDASIGSGGGGATAPSATGPAITIPLRCSASGRNTTVRVYVMVYAKMSATSSTADFGVYNLDSAGAIQGPTALTNPITVNTNTYQWYGSTGGGGALAPTADAYFLGQAHPDRRYDRVVFCGRRLTGSGNLDIGAMMFYAYHYAS